MRVVGPYSLVDGQNSRHLPDDPTADSDYYSFATDMLWQHAMATWKRRWEKMARKKKAKRFSAVTAVKELARERVGAPPSGQVVVEKKKKPEKHKPTLSQLLDET